MTDARRALAAVACLVVAGCLSTSTDPAEDDGPLFDAIPPQPIVQIHDAPEGYDGDVNALHANASLHVGGANLGLVAWAPLIPEELGTEGFAGMRIRDGIAYIATDGAHAGFVMVDVSAPRAPRLLSQYATAGGASQEAVPSWDGRWVFLNGQRCIPAEEQAAEPEKGNGYGIQIVDVSDKASPRFVKFVPVEERGTHVMAYYEMGGKQYLIYNGQQAGWASAPCGPSAPVGVPDVGVPIGRKPLGNYVRIAEFVEDGPMGPDLVPVSHYAYAPDAFTVSAQEDRCFPHDMWPEPHPDGRELLYVAHWDCGAITVDISDPANPRQLDVEDTLAPSTQGDIHFFRPDPTPRNTSAGAGRLIAYSAPEIDLSPGEPGYLRAYDATDPSDLRQIGWWRLPGTVENDLPYIFTPHNFDFHGDLMALAHYHAGIWVLDASDPENLTALAYYLPHGNESAPFEGTVWRKTPNFPVAYFPNVYEARWLTVAEDGADATYLLITERGSGLYVLRYTGPEPGSPEARAIGVNGHHG